MNLLTVSKLQHHSPESWVTRLFFYDCINMIQEFMWVCNVLILSVPCLCIHWTTYMADKSSRIFFRNIVTLHMSKVKSEYHFHMDGWIPKPDAIYLKNWKCEFFFVRKVNRDTYAIVEPRLKCRSDLWTNLEWNRLRAFQPSTFSDINIFPYGYRFFFLLLFKLAENISSISYRRTNN